MVNDFKEVNESYNIPEAIREAQRCLHCKVPGCKKGCPINSDIPDWIAELAKGNFGNAVNIINNRSNLPAVCVEYAPTSASARATVYLHPATVVHAMHDAKLVAEGIMQYVDAVKLLEHINKK